MQHEAEKPEEADVALPLAKELLSRARKLMSTLRAEGHGLRSAIPDKCLVFCLLLVNPRL